MSLVAIVATATEGRDKCRLLQRHERQASPSQHRSVGKGNGGWRRCRLLVQMVARWTRVNDALLFAEARCARSMSKPSCNGLAWLGGGRSELNDEPRKKMTTNRSCARGEPGP